MNPIESIHHLKTDDYCEYREGVTLDRPTKVKEGSWVDIGLWKHLKLEQKLMPNTRVTVKVNEKYTDPSNKSKSRSVTSPSHV